MPRISIKCYSHSRLGNFQNQIILRRFLSFKINVFQIYSVRNTISVSNSLEQDQARHLVGPELVPNSLSRFSAFLFKEEHYRMAIHKLVDTVEKYKFKTHAYF